MDEHVGEPIDWEVEEERISSVSLAAGDPTGWFDKLYAAAATGRVQLPWSRTQPHPLLVRWARRRRIVGPGQRAIVVGCALGADAEYVADFGFDTTGFDVSETAIRLAQQRFPNSRVSYVVADLLDPPRHWLGAFDLVVEIITVQALPDPPRHRAIANVSRLVAPAGTLLVIAAIEDLAAPAGPTGPWPLSRAEIDAFATAGVEQITVEKVEVSSRVSGDGPDRRWCAEFHRGYLRRRPSYGRGRS